MSYNNSRDLSRRRKLSDSFDDLEATMKEWDYFRKSIPAVATSTSTQPSGTPSPRVPTPTSARVSTPVPATASSTSFSAAPSPVQRSMRSTTAYKPQTPDRSEESGEESVPEVAPLCVRHKLARINNSPDIASHKDVDDAGRVPSPAFHRNVDVASTGSYTTYTNYTNILTRSPSPQKSFNTYNDTSGSASPSPSPARESGYNYTLTHSSYDVDSPVSQSPARYTPTGLHSTDSSATATGFIPTPIYPTPTPTSPPTTSPRKWRDSRQVPEEILEYDFNRETPQAVLDAEEAVKKRDETDVRVAEMRNLTQTAAMMELFFQAENALAAEDVDRAEWKTREGLTIAQELNDAPYIERGGYLMRVAAALENEKMREAYERAHGVQYVANGDKEGERESENDDDDEDNDLAVIGCENMADLDDQDGSKDSENNEIERNGLEIRSINTEESPLLKGVRFLHPQSGSRNSLSHTGGEERYQCPYPSEEQQNDLFPTDEPQRPRKGKPQKERKTRLRSRGLKSQYVKAKPIVLPTVYRSWEDPHSDGEEVMPVFRLVNHKRHRPQYSETCFWSYLLRLKPVSFIKTKPPHIRKRMLRTLPRS
ncbi:hypothetical protein BJX63DRAFT_117366 [Aspergillus granulosus]|uniref:Uncharacterized protein n=1 Tax=Aspergillus granulosus TaxID=176169 RepID=A0ABR4HP01_9EURO